MTDYNDGNWHPWVAGQNSTCPLHPKSHVEVLLRDGCSFTNRARQVEWRKNGDETIIAFCVTEQHQEPRDFWIWTNGHGDLVATKTWRKDAIHVREVMPDE